MRRKAWAASVRRPACVADAAAAASCGQRRSDLAECGLSSTSRGKRSVANRAHSGAKARGLGRCFTPSALPSYTAYRSPRVVVRWWSNCERDWNQRCRLALPSRSARERTLESRPFRWIECRRFSDQSRNLWAHGIRDSSDEDEPLRDPITL